MRLLRSTRPAWWVCLALAACSGDADTRDAEPSPALLRWAGNRAAAARPMISDVLERSSASLGTIMELAKAGRGPGQLLAPVAKTWLLGDFCADPRYVRCVVELGLAEGEGGRERMTGPHHDDAAPLPEGPAQTQELPTALGPATLELVPALGGDGAPRVRFQLAFPDGEGVVKLDLVDRGAPAELEG